MVSTYTPNTNIELQGTGDNSGTWGAVLNTAALTIIDNVFGGVQTFSLSNVNVTVSTTQSQNNAFKLTGTLTGNVDITFPAVGRTLFIANNTTGNYVVTLKCAGAGTSATVAQGRNGFFVFDGTNVIVDNASATPAGAVTAFAMSTAPAGWLECDGSAISRTTYATLFTAIGTTFGTGDGSTTFNIPDLRGYFVRGWANAGAIDPARVFGSVQAAAVESHTHVFTGAPLAPHPHPFRVTGSSTPADGVPGLNNAGSAVTFTYTGTTPTDNPGESLAAASAGTPAGTNANYGGDETRPINVALMYCIKT